MNETTPANDNGLTSADEELIADILKQHPVLMRDKAIAMLLDAGWL